MSDWYKEKSIQVLKHFKSDGALGLTDVEAAHRLKQQGPNELVERGVRKPWKIFLAQFSSTVVMVLIAAGLISAVIADFKDASAIFAIVLLNALLGFIQEYKAETALAALKKMAVPTVKVRREGHVREIPARELVPGDIILLEAGNLVPADARLLVSVNLRVQESALTGESQPVEKNSDAVAEEKVSLADRRNLVYLGTVVTYGRAQALVTETGMSTELGAIASMIGTAGEGPTPLQKRLDQLGKRLAWVAIAIVGLVFVLGLLRGEGWRVMFLTAVSMAVAAIPEGLPAVVTIALALGAQRMLKRRALIRKLPAVETLGSVTVICSDKTGTLTQNKMTVTVLDVAGHRADLEQMPQAPMGTSTEKVLCNHSALALLLSGSALCNDAVLERAGDDFQIIGDPTEGALLAAAAREGLEKEWLEKIFPRVAEIPFDSERKRMTSIHRSPTGKLQEPAAIRNWEKWVGDGPYIAFTKGAVDGLLEISNRVWIDERVQPITEMWRERIKNTNRELAQNGMRVLGLSFRPIESALSDGNKAAAERDLIFVGLVGMIDPARPQVKEAVQTCKAAGIRPVMITGDHPLTAQYIAAQLGIDNGHRVMTGQELEALSPADLEEIVEKVSIFARVSPEHKFKLVQAFQRRGHSVAMTGDGVNDAPALKQADIGVAMGLSGTDVSKEAADMVLLDDNFATIVSAVEEGRVIYDNIRKFIKYLLTTNSAELWVMLLAPFLGMPLPLLPLQILWINLVTDGPTALTLGVEGPERNIMRRPPYKPDENIFGRGLGRHAVWVGALMTLLSLGIGLWYWRSGQENWQTMLFTTLAFSQMGHVLAIRSERDSLFHMGLLSNKWLFCTVLTTLLLQMAVVYLPFLQEIFKTVPLSLLDLILAFILSGIVLGGVEVEKWILRRWSS